MGGSPEEEASLVSTCTPPIHPVCPTTAGPQSQEQSGCPTVLQKNLWAATEAGEGAPEGSHPHHIASC